MKGTHMRQIRSLLIVGAALLGAVTPVSTAGAEAPSVGTKLLRIANCETGGTMNPAIVSKSGKYHGLFQFDQRTWDATAVRAGRPDLVGLRPSRVHFLNQILLALELYEQRGPQPWPVCGYR